MDSNFVVEVRPGGSAAHSNRADGFPSLDLFAYHYKDLAQVSVAG